MTSAVFLSAIPAPGHWLWWVICWLPSHLWPSLGFWCSRMNESIVCCSTFRCRSRSRRINSRNRRMLKVMHNPPNMKAAISQLQYSTGCASLLKLGPSRQRRNWRLGIARQVSRRMLTPLTTSVTTPDASGFISFHFIIVAQPQLRSMQLIRSRSW